MIPRGLSFAYAYNQDGLYADISRSDCLSAFIFLHPVPKAALGLSRFIYEARSFGAPTATIFSSKNISASACIPYILYIIISEYEKKWTCLCELTRFQSWSNAFRFKEQLSEDDEYTLVCDRERDEGVTPKVDAFHKDSMKNDYTKTDRIILLIQTICRSPRLLLTESKVKEILGDPSRAQWYKLKQELLEDNGPRKSILIEMKDEEGNTTYQLNQCDWFQYLEGAHEIQFILKFYKELGHLFPKIDTGGLTAHSKKLDRKFYYLCKNKVRENIDNGESHLETIIRFLTGDRKMLIDYKSSGEKVAKTIDIFPLTLTQYRDDLYLMAYKSEMKEENIRSYKVSRIEKIQELKEKFKYPIESKWNPKEYFKNTSGIIAGPIKTAKFKVYGNSKNILAEKKIFDAEIINSAKEYDEYICHYTNIEEFMGLLFIYGQDVEIVSDSSLRKAFKEKAEKIIKRNT